MVGGPALKSKMFAKDDIILAIDGEKVQRSSKAIKAFQGPLTLNTAVTLMVEKAKTRKVEEVVL